MSLAYLLQGYTVQSYILMAGTIFFNKLEKVDFFFSLFYFITLRKGYGKI